MLRNLRELYQYRALVLALVVRHLTARYRGSLLGFLWSLLNPLLLMLVYLLVFQYYIRFNQVDNYTIFLFVGLLPWIWVSSALIEGTAAIVNSGHLITKSMFPAHLLPTIAVITSLVNFLLSLPILFVLMLLMGIKLQASVLLVPLVLLLQFLFLHGLTLALGALNVHYRDVQHIVTNLLTFLFFLCPIVYPASIVPQRFQFSLLLNPFALFTTYYHGLMLEGRLPSLETWVILCGFVGCALILGHLVFDHYRESFAEAL